MPPKKLYPFNGKMVPGEPVEVNESTEPWAQFALSDGTNVKAKMVLLEVVRLEAHHEATGDPVYQFQFQQIIGIVAPDALKRKVN